jgi:hypothetical protein
MKSTQHSKIRCSGLAQAFAATIGDEGFKP